MSKSSKMAAHPVIPVKPASSSSGKEEGKEYQWVAEFLNRSNRRR